MTCKTVPRDRYFEDYAEGSVHEFGYIAVDEGEMIAFARRFDPQPFHTDPEAARLSVFGGLIASGWFTAGLLMRALVDNYVSRVASLGSPGADELRWLKPVRPGDILSVRVTVLKTQRLRSKPDRGFVRTSAEVFNQNGDAVMTMRSGGFVLRRNGRRPTREGA